MTIPKRKVCCESIQAEVRHQRPPTRSNVICWGSTQSFPLSLVSFCCLCLVLSIITATEYLLNSDAADSEEDEEERQRRAAEEAAHEEAEFWSRLSQCSRTWAMRFAKIVRRLKPTDENLIGFVEGTNRFFNSPLNHFRPSVASVDMRFEKVVLHG